MYTALITPYEVAFLPQASFIDPLFITNRFIDLIFLIDMMLQFRLAYKSEGPSTGTVWHTKPEEIARHYVHSKWFYIDSFSILTFLFDVVGNEDTSNLTVLRAVRVLRLAKLIRLARGSRIFKKWEMTVSINYAILSLVNIMIGICIACHWFACLWGLEASFWPLDSWLDGSQGYCEPWPIAGGYDAEYNVSMATSAVCPEDSRGARVCSIGLCTDGSKCSIEDCNDGMCTGGHACADHFVIYSAAFYFSVMTITSVGYGDILPKPYNVVEQMLCSVIILLGGMLWGFLIGTFCGLAANLSPSVQAFREELSQLNSFMEANNLPYNMCFRLREYIHETIHMRNTESNKRLLRKLSPSMQLEVSWIVNHRWVEMVWYLRGVNRKLLIDLAQILTAQVFAPREFCPHGIMYIIQRGSALWGGKMRRAGSVWGDDIVLQNADLQLKFPALCATYLWAYTIQARTLLSCIHKYPDFEVKFNGVRKRWLVRRALVREAEIRCYAEGEVFRGRDRPIYAHHIADAITRVRVEQDAAEAIHRPLQPMTTRHSRALSPHPRRKGLLSLDCLRNAKQQESKTSSQKVRRRQRASIIQAAAMEVGLEMRHEEMDVETSSAAVEKVALVGRVDRMESKLDNIERMLAHIVGGPLPPASAPPASAPPASAPTASPLLSPALSIGGTPSAAGREAPRSPFEA